MDTIIQLLLSIRNKYIMRLKFIFNTNRFLLFQEICDINEAK